MTQADAVLMYLADNEYITPFEAFTELGITKLATVVSDLRHKEGYEFDIETISKKNRYGHNCNFCRYKLKGKRNG